MKILFVSPHLPAPKTYQAGERLLFEIIKWLSERHEIHLVVRLYERQQKDVGAVKAYCKSVVPVFYKRPERRDVFTIPRVVLSYYRLCKRANEIAGKEHFDGIHAEWTETGLFLRKRGRMVITAYDVLTKPMERRYRDSKGMRRFVNFILYRFTKRLEYYIYKKFDIVFVLSGYDKGYLLSIEPSLNVSLLTYPAGLDISDKRFEQEENSILFVGAMDRGPNVEAVIYFWNKILPLIRERVPEVKLYIVGSRPPPEILELVNKDKNTTVTGFVEEVGPYYKRATVFVAPLLTGGGIIVKILDAMASGTPVVTTSIGNEGIGATPGEHLLIGDGPGDFAIKVIRLIEDRELRASLSQAAQGFVKEHYGPQSWKRQIEAMYGSRLCPYPSGYNPSAPSGL